MKEMREMQTQQTTSDRRESLINLRGVTKVFHTDEIATRALASR